MKNSEFQFITIESAKPPCHPDEVTVKGYKTCKSGVMKGQTLAHYIQSFDCAEDAAEAYPEATNANQFTVPQPTFDHLQD